jgi:hypothetical protein
MLEFARHFKGALVTETMLVDDLNVGEAALEMWRISWRRCSPRGHILLCPRARPLSRGR